jgi:hypothetical protein
MSMGGTVANIDRRAYGWLALTPKCNRVVDA